MRLCKTRRIDFSDLVGHIVLTEARRVVSFCFVPRGAAGVSTAGFW